MDIHHFRYFVTVADLGSFTKAATALGVSASPLARRVRDLESYLGAELLDRQAKPLIPTPYGLTLLPLARAAVDSFDEAMGMRRRSERLSPLRIGLPPGLPAFMSDALHDALLSFPRDGRPSFLPASSKEQTDLVAQGELDLGIVRIIYDEPLIARMDLIEEPYEFAVSPDMAADFGQALAAGSLSGWSLVGAYVVHPIPHVAKLLDRYGVEDFIRIPGADQKAIATILRGERRFVVLSATNRDDGVAYAHFTPESDPPFALTTTAIWRRDRPDVEEFVQSFAASIGEALMDELGQNPAVGGRRTTLLVDTD